MLKEEMEMRIAICDDEKIALEQTCNIVKDVFDEESSNRNKVVLVTTHKVDDISALKDKMDELSDYGIIPFVFVLNADTNNALNMDGIYQCPTDLDLRLSISDLYLAFCKPALLSAPTNICLSVRKSLNTLYTL